MMLNIWDRTALGLLSLATVMACSSEPETGEERVTASGGAAVASTGGANGAGGSLQASVGGAGSGFGMIALGSGGTASAAGGAQDAVLDGGLIPLDPDVVAKIKAGACEDDSEEVTALPPVLQFVVDASGSMRSAAPGDPGLSKWDVTEAALLEALDALPDEMPVGLQLYPSVDAPFPTDCSPGGFGMPTGPGGFGMSGTGGTAGGIPATGGDAGAFPPQQQQAAACISPDALTPIAPLGAPGDAQRTALAQAIEGAQLYDGTPTHDAYLFALEESLKKDTSGRRQFMLLITDGAPTQILGCGPLICDDLFPDGPEATAIIEAIAAAHAEGVDTYVIGSPGSEDGSFTGGGEDMRPWLSQAATAGGTALEGCTGTEGNFCHFDMTQATNFGQALAEGLSKIAGDLEASCDFEIPQRMDVDVEATEVVISWGDGTADKAVLDVMGDCTEGWRQTGPTTMELCPNTCAAFQADHGATVSVSFNCISEIR